MDRQAIRNMFKDLVHAIDEHTTEERTDFLRKVSQHFTGDSEMDEVLDLLDMINAGHLDKAVDEIMKGVDELGTDRGETEEA